MDYKTGDYRYRVRWTKTFGHTASSEFFEDVSSMKEALEIVNDIVAKNKIPGYQVIGNIELYIIHYDKLIVRDSNNINRYKYEYVWVENKNPTDVYDKEGNLINNEQ